MEGAEKATEVGVGNAEALARFAREARAAVKVEREHVAPVIDLGTRETGARYIAMEFTEAAISARGSARKGLSGKLSQARAELNTCANRACPPWSGTTAPVDLGVREGRDGSRPWRAVVVSPAPLGVCGGGRGDPRTRRRHGLRPARDRGLEQRDGRVQDPQLPESAGRPEQSRQCGGVRYRIDRGLIAGAALVVLGGTLILTAPHDGGVALRLEPSAANLELKGWF
jgi:hypothetical protein